MKHWFEHVNFAIRSQPARPAIVLEDRVVTYGMLGEGIASAASRIAALQLAPGKPVAVVFANPIRHMVLCLALARIGVPSLSLMPQHLRLSGLPHAVALVETPGAASSGSAREVVVGDDWFSAAAPAAAGLPQGFTDSRQICRLALSSGTTGTPKAIAYSVEAVGRYFTQKVLCGIDACRNGVLCMPGLTSNYGYTIAGATLVAGRTLYFAETPGQAIRMIELYGIDFAQVSTEQLLSLTRVARASGAALRSLDIVSVGGSAMSRALLEAATRHLCKEIWCRYGASEAGSICHASAREVIEEPDLIGVPLPGFDVRVFDASGGPVAPGTPGRLMVRTSLPSDCRMGSACDEPWIDLGDLGVATRDGRFHVLGRQADEVGGDRTGQRCALEAEHALLLGSAIEDAAAICVSDDGAERRIRIAIVGRGNVTDAELDALLQPQKLDVSVVLQDFAALPRNVNGKVDRAMLRGMMAASAIAPSRS